MARAGTDNRIKDDWDIRKTICYNSYEFFIAQNANFYGSDIFLKRRLNLGGKHLRRDGGNGLDSSIRLYRNSGDRYTCRQSCFMNGKKIAGETSSSAGVHTAYQQNRTCHRPAVAMNAVAPLCSE